MITAAAAASASNATTGATGGNLAPLLLPSTAVRGDASLDLTKGTIATTVELVVVVLLLLLSLPLRLLLLLLIGGSGAS